MKRVVKVGNCNIGGDNPVSIQSMTNTLTTDIDSTINQINKLADNGCDIVRVSVPDIQSANSIKSIIAGVNVPVVADIHYDYKLAILACDSGAAKIRINPGNIGDEDKVKYLAEYLKERSIPIRIGVNSGSIDKRIESLYGNTPKALAESAMANVSMLEKVGFYDIIISVKSSNVLGTIEAYKLVDQMCDYPLHIGVTEAGYDEAGIVKSSVGIGSLLYQGIGNTIRVSLTGDPVREVIVAKRILQSLNLYNRMPEIISCPTCARTSIDVDSLARQVDKRLKNVNKHIKVAVMGCVVNGPGEAKEADIGIAGGKDKSVIFLKGKVIATVSNEKLVDELMLRMDNLLNE